MRLQFSRCLSLSLLQLIYAEHYTLHIGLILVGLQHTVGLRQTQLGVTFVLLLLCWAWGS
jgi:hypothetical protein